MPDTPPDMQPQDEGRLVLPPLTADASPAHDEGTVMMPPSIPLSSPLPYKAVTQVPNSRLGKVGYLWHTDPAYRILIVSIVLAIIASFTLIAFLGSALMQVTGIFTGVSQNNATGPKAQATVDLRPTFPTPGGGQGSTQTSQPPKNGTPVVAATSTPLPSPTVTVSPAASPTPSPTPTSTTLSVQITSAPARASNNTTVTIGVTTSQGGVQVQLTVFYNALPGTYFSGTQVTDASGHANIPWHIHIFVRNTTVVAHLIVTARDANGQTVTSPTVTVQIVNNVGG